MGFLLPLCAIGALAGADNATMLGWTADGHFLVWEKSDYAASGRKVYRLPKGDGFVDVPDPSKLSAADQARLDVTEVMDDEGQTNESVELAIVHDVLRGTDQTYFLSYSADTYEGKTHPTLATKYVGLPTKAAWDAWQKAHPVVPMKVAKKDPHGGSWAITVTHPHEDGADEIDVDPPKWKGNAYTWETGMTANVELATTCGKARDAVTIQQGMAAMYMPTWSATSVWDPTGRRVLFVLNEAEAKTMRGMQGGGIAYVIAPCGTRVDVVAPAGLEAAADPVTDAVEKAGFSVTSIGPAQAKRATTVIYADDAHRDAAAALAKVIPGGATVDKLTWKPDADLVVAIGDSAR